ncbi:MAG: DUF2059 domain-containing protein [Brevundimonas sp.]
MTGIREWILAGAIALAFSGPTFAQDAGLQRRTEMSRELITLSAGPNFMKLIEQSVSDQLEKSIHDQSAEAVWVRENMPAMARRMMTRIMDDMAPLYAQTFNEAELSAQIDFYRTPVGRSVASKTVELGLAQEEMLQGAMASFLTEFEAKYCAQFDCGGEDGQAAVKPGRS